MAKAKTRSYTPKYTDAQKKKILAKVQDLTAKDIPLSRAITQSGITYGTYRSWTNTGKPTRRKSPIESLMIPLDKDAPVIVLVGKPQDVNNTLQHLSSILKG